MLNPTRYSVNALKIVCVACLLVLMGAQAGLGDTPAPVPALGTFADQSYIYIATVRKDGNQSKAVPVWFVVTPDSQILFDTSSDSWKARRIRRGSPVLIWLGSREGPAFIGKAEIVTDAAVQDQMIDRIPAKYFLARMGFFGPSRAKFDSGKIITLRITPVRGLPSGFQSQPGTPAP
jgi:PPOX class probable F420-dependent enzyme